MSILVILRGAAACVKDGKVLLGYRPRRNWWELPGGKVKEEEDPSRAAARELKEETGLSAPLPAVFGYPDLFLEPGKLVVTMAYLFTQWEGYPRPQPGECLTDFAWYSCGESISLSPQTTRLLPPLMFMASLLNRQG